MQKGVVESLNARGVALSHTTYSQSTCIALGKVADRSIALART